MDAVEKQQGQAGWLLTPLWLRGWNLVETAAVTLLESRGAKQTSVIGPICARVDQLFERYRQHTVWLHRLSLEPNQILF